MIRNLFTSLFIIILLPGCRDENRTTPSGSNLEKCLIPTSASSFDIITWNAKDFPIDGDNTIRKMAGFIKEENADLIALQEITSTNALDRLLEELPEWDSRILPTGDLNLAFIYKTSEVSLKGSAANLFTDDEFDFPRPPLLISVSHKNGFTAFLINVHFKCCGGSVNEYRRRKAGMLLKSYLDEKLKDENVIVLGDFNDEIFPVDSGRNVYYNFIADSLHYRFADMNIARDSSVNWSYPEWPSHIDHILITDELFDHVTSTATLSLEKCDPDYLADVSDHRPLIIRVTK